MMLWVSMVIFMLTSLLSFVTLATMTNTMDRTVNTQLAAVVICYRYCRVTVKTKPGSTNVVGMLALGAVESALHQLGVTPSSNAAQVISDPDYFGWAISEDVIGGAGRIQALLFALQGELRTRGLTVGWGSLDKWSPA